MTTALPLILSLFGHHHDAASDSAKAAGDAEARASRDRQEADELLEKEHLREQKDQQKQQEQLAEQQRQRDEAAAQRASEEQKRIADETRRAAEDSAISDRAQQRQKLWSSQNTAGAQVESSSTDAGSVATSHEDKATESLVEQSIAAVEKAAHVPSPDPINDLFDQVLDGDERGSTVEGALTEVSVEKVRDAVVDDLRDGVGKAACGSDNGGSGDTRVDGAYSGFWSGVCGGWIGRPLSPSGVYGYLRENVVGGFDRFFGTVTKSFGLMPDK